MERLEAPTEDLSAEPSSGAPRGIRWIDFLLVALILGVLVRLVVPWALDKVRRGRILAQVDLVREARSGVARYAAEVGTLLPLDDAGQGNGNASLDLEAPGTLAWVLTREVPPSVRGAWARWRGPYLRRIHLRPPPLGSVLAIEVATIGGVRGLAGVPAFQGATPASAGATGRTVAWMSLHGVDRRDFLSLDSLLERIPAGNGLPERSGEVLWSEQDGGVVRILLLQR